MKHREVDLHGLYTEEVAKDVSKHIFDLRNGKIDSILFVTGKGTGALKAYVEEFLEKNELIWEIKNNGTSYYVTAVNRGDEDDLKYHEDDMDKEELESLFEEFTIK